MREAVVPSKMELPDFKYSGATAMSSIVDCLTQIYVFNEQHALHIFLSWSISVGMCQGS